MGGLDYRPGGTYRLSYTYRNRQSRPVELWVAVPPELPVQHVRLVAFNPEPDRRPPSPDGLGDLIYIRLAPGATFAMDVTVETRQVYYRPELPPGGATLSAAERALYLRSTPSIPVTPEIEVEARKVAGGASEPLEQVRLLFHHIVAQYRYVYPPPERGAESMRQHRQGDCGEFSFLLAAWCRALGIPCRVLFGTWAKRAMQGHVWNEAFIEGVGWVPIDGSMAAVTLGGRWHRWRGPQPGQSEQDFAEYEGKRIVFSIDADRELAPAYAEDPNPPADAVRMRVGGANLIWGYTLAQGRAPYLQPVYIRFEAAKGPYGDNDLLGHWTVQAAGGAELLRWLQTAGLMAGLAGTLMDWSATFGTVATQVGLGFLRTYGFAGYLLWSVCSAWRGEHRWLSVPMALLFFVYGLIYVFTN